MPGRRARTARAPAAPLPPCCSGCQPSAYLRHDRGEFPAPGARKRPRSRERAMLIAAAVCPHPPLPPPPARGAAADDPPPALCAVGDACNAAVQTLAAAEPDLIAVVGGGPAGREFPADAAGALDEYGVPVMIGDGEPVLPLPL